MKTMTTKDIKSSCLVPVVYNHTLTSDISIYDQGTAAILLCGSNFDVKLSVNALFELGEDIHKLKQKMMAVKS